MNLIGVDSNFRYYISFLYRLLVTVYAFCIYYFNKYNFFDSKWYLIAFVSYWLIFALCYTRKNLSRVRFVNDYIFILFILYNRDLSTIDNAMFLLLPILNSFNHTGERKMFFTLLLYAIPCTVLFIENEIALWQLCLPIMALATINTFFRARSVVFQFNEKLNHAFENSLIDGKDIGSAHKILEKFKRIHQAEKLANYFINIEEVVCFKFVDNNTLVLINSSRFIIKWKILDPTFLATVNRTKSSENVSIDIDDWDTKENIFYRIQLKDNIFGFLLVFKSKPMPLLYDVYVQKILFPVLKRMGHVIVTESDIRNEKRKLLNEIKSKFLYLDLSNNAIHFLNNKLNSLSLFFQLQDEVKNLDPNSQIFKDTTTLLNSTFSESKSNFQLAMDRVKNVMDSPSNPLDLKQFTEIKIQTVFFMVRDLFQQYNFGFPDSLIQIYWTSEDLERSIKIHVSFFEFVLDEIFLNIEKHNNGEIFLLFGKEADSLYIEFSNKIKPRDTSLIDIFDKFISEFNNESMNEISKRGIKGSRLLKQFLVQLSLKHEMRREDHQFYIKNLDTMKIAIFENEISIIQKSFEAINILYFNKGIEFEYFKTSQEFGDYNRLTEYNVIILDIDLSLKSKMDGYQILQEIKAKSLLVPNIIILTGHNNVQEKLKEIGFENLPIVSKPINIKNLSEDIKRFFS